MLCLSKVKCGDGALWVIVFALFAEAVWNVESIYSLSVDSLFVIRKNLLALCLVADPKRSWEDIEKWCIVELRNDSLRSRLCILSLVVAVYNL
jgi:hypothetical protein